MNLRPTVDEGLVGHAPSARLLEGFDHIQHRAALSGPEIDSEQVAFLVEVIQCGEVTLRQVHYMKVVANAGAQAHPTWLNSRDW